MIFNIAIDIFVKAQKSRDSEMPLPAPRGTESGFKLSSLSSQWPKARRARARGGGRGQGACKGSPLSRHVVSQRLPFGLESIALSARVCVCVYLCPGARTQEGGRGRGDDCCLSGINKCRNRQFGRLAALFQHRCLSYMHQIQLNSTRGRVRPTLLQTKCVWGLNGVPMLYM